MGWARVPKASINEQTDSLTSKHEVRAAPDLRLRSSISLEFKAILEEKSTKHHFRGGLVADIRSHNAGDNLRSGARRS